MENVILQFAKQFEFEPKIENVEQYKKLSKFIVSGMGGSHLAAGLFKIWDPYIPLLVHRDYGLPALSKETLREHTFIACSYSGNTEEVLDSLASAEEEGLNILIISSGGTLIQKARKKSLPYIQIPDTGIQPRSALGFMSMALSKALFKEDALQELEALQGKLDPTLYREKGRERAEKMRGRIPVIYSSAQNKGLAYNWKIKFNETGKIPAFCNVFPELNHNEMTGFDVRESVRAFAQNFYFIFLKDEHDHPRIQKRMGVLAEQLQTRGFPVETISLQGEAIFLRIFQSLLGADWTTFFTATQYGLEPEKVPMVEEFKKLIS